MRGEPQLSFLEWDSEFFGCRIARVESSAFDERSAKGLLRQARSESIECLYLLVDAANSESVRAAERLGFSLVDVRVTRDCTTLTEDPGRLPEMTDLCREEDIANLIDIARESHGDSRFYHDPRFSDERCDDLYATWIENACRGAAAGVVVLRDEGRAVGYITCEIPQADLGVLGLVAIADEKRGMGYGARLFNGAMGWLAGQGCSRIRAVTQARNIAATRVYEANGFRTVSVENSYHLWLDGVDGVDGLDGRGVQ
jgi:RimJ/RimL family protein N-acetyltransferase